MKIGIITFHFSINYGAILQAYALQKTLEKMGHEVEIIDYQPDYHVQRHNWTWRFGGLHVRNFVLPGLRKKFSDFSSRHLQFTPRTYCSLNELKQDPPAADAYICGSDQIWNPDLTNLDPAYFATFGTQSIKRIAYAASFGKTSLTQTEKEAFKQCIQYIDHISIREQAGIDLANNVADVRAEWVLDPTLLMEDYEPITAPAPFRQKFVLMLNLQNNPLLNQAAEYVSNETGYPLVVLNNLSMKFWSLKGKRCYPSPEGYLGLIKSAECVVTNSFHGTVFSVLFRKPFLTTSLSEAKADKNNRMTGLLASCGLTGRFINKFSNATISKALSEKIDWVQTNRSIETQRKSSLNFLNTALIN